MNSRTLGILAVALAAVAIATTLIVRQQSAKPVEQTPSTDSVDKLVIDYAFHTMQLLAKSAVTRCGLDLDGQEADVTARVNVTNQVLHLSKVRFTQNAWSSEKMACVTREFEGQERNPMTDGVREKFPEGSEYEFDAHLAFVKPTLQYTE